MSTQSDAERLRLIAALAVRPDTADEAWVALMHICRVVEREIAQQKTDTGTAMARYFRERSEHFRGQS